MKKYLVLLAALALSVSCLTSCDDEFLNCYPSTSFSEANVFNNYQLTENYIKNLYGIFTDDPYGTTGIHDSYFFYPGISGNAIGSGKHNEDIFTGILINTYACTIGSEAGSTWGKGQLGINQEESYYSAPYIWIRDANIVLKNIETIKANCTAEQAAHVEAEARFFRAYCHWSLLYNLGDAIYLDQLVNDGDEESLKPAKTNRATLADNIFEEYDWCLANIHDELCAPNTINSDVIRAAFARFCLFEGTFRKYQGLNISGKHNTADFLNKALELSKAVMTKHPLYQGAGKDNIAGEGFSARFTTRDLGTVSEVLLYNKQITDYAAKGKSLLSNELFEEMPQWMVDLYTTEEGYPIHSNKAKHYEWNGTSYVECAAYDYANCDPYKTFRKRDPRLVQTVVPPYSVVVDADNSSVFKLADNAKYNEYLNLFPIAGTKNAETGKYTVPVCTNFDAVPHAKTLPLVVGGQAFVLDCMPNLRVGVQQMSALDGTIQYWCDDTKMSTMTGYGTWFQYDLSAVGTDKGGNPNDVPIFMSDEMFLTFIEAFYEINGKLEGEALSAFNSLRKRGGITKDFDASVVDPDCPEGVNPVLWEIRRERIIELYGLGFSRMDAVRWKMGPWFAAKQGLGVWVNAEDVKKININNSAFGFASTGLANNATGAEADAATVASQGGGHVYTFKKPTATWQDKWYTRPVPTFEMSLNENLTQTQGW